MTSVLEAVGVTKMFGGLRALSQVDITIEEGQIFSVIGPNGAGKTTFFNMVTGIYPPTAGSIKFKGVELLEPTAVGGIPLVKRPRRPFQITRLGIGRTFQNIRLFPNMTALENVMVGIDAHNRAGVGRAMLRTPRQRREESVAVERARELLDFVGIGRYSGELAKNLAYGDQRRLEVARAMGTNPTLLLLDEPAAGMNPAEKAALMRLIQRVRDQAITVLLIEHDMKVVMGIGHAPEGRRIFGRMTVKENLEMGLYASEGVRGASRTDAGAALDRVYGLFPVLKDRASQLGGTLSGGEQQMLAIGRALMTRPDVLMLDEPSMGLAPMLVERIFGIIKEINEQGTTVLLIEQNAHMALQLANRGYVLESGSIVLEDSAQNLLGNDQVRKAYLGEE